MALFTIAELNALLRTLVTGITIVGNDFAAANPDDCAYTRINGGRPPNEWSSVSRPSVQIVIRAKKSPDAEAKAYAFFNALHNRQEFAVGTTRVIRSEAEQSAPFYLGTDESARTLYSVNFTFTTA
ncbi:minor capsid protein [Paenibacillus tengchongensis]|uniref:minor capsid protein n=1 Tax=Paenibacillus tengchongensis TaxID=2608684 RepID=UPI00124E65FD|nr:minor capsid protein [Paenibacillus tengchongensis]